MEFLRFGEADRRLLGIVQGLQHNVSYLKKVYICYIYKTLLCCVKTLFNKEIKPLHRCYWGFNSKSSPILKKKKMSIQVGGNK